MGIQKATAIAEKGMSFEIAWEAGLFPTLEILNSFFMCGIDDAESEITLQWEPFSLTSTEFDTFYEACQMSNGKLEVDDLGFKQYPDGASGFISLVKNRARDIRRGGRRLVAEVNSVLDHLGDRQ